MKITKMQLYTEEIQNKVHKIVNQYGVSGLEQALDYFIEMNQMYTICTRELITKIRVSDIYYLETRGHHIKIYTETEIYRKYGTLNKELETLSRFNFLKCNQSYVVSLTKIKSIYHHEIILINNQKIPMSRKYATQVILAFYNIS